MDTLRDILQKDDLPSLREWLEDDLNKTVRDNNGNTPLHLVASHVMVQLLSCPYQSDHYKEEGMLLKWLSEISKDGDKNTCNADNCTPAHCMYVPNMEADCIPYQIMQKIW